jgi:cardiolipin synthase A/B
MEWTRNVKDGWPVILPLIWVLLAVVASSHAVIYKRHPRSAVLWVGMIWMMPLAGALLYVVFGINRIKRRARILRKELQVPQFLAKPAFPIPPRFNKILGRNSNQWTPHLQAVDNITCRPLLSGNAIHILNNGEETYSAMLEAIGSARETVSLSAYIMDHSPVGLKFVEALQRAKERGVQVRVLVDSTGARYSFPTIFRALKKASVRHARFLPFSAIKRPLTLNLHNHRKLLIVDGKHGFTGGMNIREDHLLKNDGTQGIQDFHFSIHGPVVEHMQEAFMDDWFFSTGERLSRARWFPKLFPAGQVCARGITDGPDEDLDKLRWVILSSCHSARRLIQVMTPYFLPDSGLISALCLASMRGVDVQILLPSKSNLPFVHWAMQAMLWQILVKGCRVWLSPPPFDHGKLMLVDGLWGLIGSANWDPRSLRLNFEFNIECYDAETVGQLEAFVENKRAKSRELTLEMLNARSLPVKIRDGLARLATPYL